jgi:exodeoxyribonuclease VII small subunit
MASTQDIAALSFEDALERAGSRGPPPESGEAPLDESIDLYARGGLAHGCQARLDAAQARIEAVVAKGGQRQRAVRRA